MRGNWRKIWLSVMGAVLVLGLPGGASAADAVTCADGYLLCLNDASQADSGRTWKELGCLRSYGSCLREQAFGS